MRSDIEIGSEWTGNVYQDYSALPDRAGILNINIHSSLNYTPVVFSWWDYQLSLKKYSDFDFFDYNLHTLNGRISKNIGEWGGVELKLLYLLYQQSNYSPYNFSNLYLLPEIKYYITDYTILKLGYTASNVVYPEYILDYNSSGASVKINQEFSLFTSLELSVSASQKNYPEWQIFTSSAGAFSSESQKADETETGLYFTHIMQKGQAGCYCTYASLDSNANFVDYGKDITLGTGDESLVGNYYNNLSRKFGGYIQYKIFGGLTSFISFSMKDTIYQSRLARNLLGEFTGEKRTDWNTSAAVSISYPLAKIEGTSLDIKLDYTNETNSSNDYFYDYKNEITGLSFLCRF